ncbi:hypothetical protein FEM33_06830 [Dyadobacter flavalbus]|uniref:Outer membrane protein beta-barrel domain-containing protein n=1 Tax=Dyadobacter flavalbus TaxID=2579942 RepID=A0A5M8QZZ7_9BACT|nr:hypothetical protein [Dyadobacter flavalbus]KAA6440314.1 hypothetical protein FEM33_06830 [Dyadobacter flavalbus]
MKNKILLLCTMLLMILACPTLMAQNDEYYRPDSLRNENPQETEEKPVQAPKPVEKKKDVEFSQLPFLERLRLGGSFGLSLGTVTNINLSPMAGYELTEKLIAGLGPTLMYFRYKYYDINTAYYGGRGFLMYSVVPKVKIIAEFEALNVEGSYQKRQWLASPMAGAAYSMPIGGRFIKEVHFTGLYNFSYNTQIDPYSRQNLSPYGSPFVFRVTFL